MPANEPVFPPALVGHLLGMPHVLRHMYNYRVRGTRHQRVSIVWPSYMRSRVRIEMTCCVRPSLLSFPFPFDRTVSSSLLQVWLGLFTS